MKLRPASLKRQRGFIGTGLRGVGPVPGGGGFSPLTLFINGEEGGWWDPSDFSTMAQDTNGTPVTAVGQPVGLILDKRLGLSRGANVWSNASAVGVNANIAEQADGSFNITVTTASFPGVRVTTGGAFTSGEDWRHEFSWSGNDEGRTIGFNVGGATRNISNAPSGSVALYVQVTAATQAISYFTSDGQVGDTFNVKVTSVQKVFGNHRVQTTAASRPTLQQDASGYYYLSYDGVDDFMVTAASVDFSLTSKATAWIGARKESDATVNMLLELGAAVSTTDGSFTIFGPGSGGANSWSVGARGTATGFQSVTGFPAPNASVLTGVYDLSAAAGSQVGLRVNGAAAVFSPTALGGGNFTSNLIYFGRRAGLTLPLTGREYQTIIRGAATDAAQIALVERFIGSKMGIAL